MKETSGGLDLLPADAVACSNTERLHSVESVVLVRWVLHPSLRGEFFGILPPTRIFVNRPLQYRNSGLLHVSTSG